MYDRSHREANKARKMKLLPLTIAASFIQHFYIESWANTSCVHRKEKLMKVVSKTDKGS